MSKQDYARQDAAEMAHILRTAKCLTRYDQISHQLLSELLIAIATEGEVIGGNNRGSDVRSEQYGLIEVKSRILGTDGPFPRISLKQHNLDKAQWFAAVRWHRDFSLYDAIMLPKTSVEHLFLPKQKERGSTHISWQDWISAPLAKNLREPCLQALIKLCI